MKDKHEIEAMRETAYAKSLEAVDKLNAGLVNPIVADRGRSFAEGVEAGLLWALSYAGSPFAD